MYELCIEKQTVETTRLVCGVSRVPDGEGAWSQSPDSMRASYALGSVPLELISRGGFKGQRLLT